MIHPAGTFNDVAIRDHGFDKSKNDSLFLWVRFESEEGNVIGRFYMTAKAIEFTVEKIAAMGFTGESLEELADGENLKGNLVQITVEHDTYEDKTSAKVQFVNENNSTGGLNRDEGAAANAKAFDALWRKASKKPAQTVDPNDPPF